MEIVVVEVDKVLFVPGSGVIIIEFNIPGSGGDAFLSVNIGSFKAKIFKRDLGKEAGRIIIVTVFKYPIIGGRIVKLGIVKWVIAVTVVISAG